MSTMFDAVVQAKGAPSMKELMDSLSSPIVRRTGSETVPKKELLFDELSVKDMLKEVLLAVQSGGGTRTIATETNPAAPAATYGSPIIEYNGSSPTTTTYGG